MRSKSATFPKITAYQLPMLPLSYTVQNTTVMYFNIFVFFCNQNRKILLYHKIFCLTDTI